MRSLRRSLVLVGIFLLIFSAKLRLIESVGFALPTWDQWDSECELTLRPWLEGRLSVKDLFVSHVEHRIVTTKATALAVLAANGQWDGLVETTFNASVHTLSAMALILLGRRWITGGWQIAYAAIVILLFALPIGWENTLVGFQVQFYYLLLFSLLHVSLVLETDQFTWRWAGGILSGFLALISMASGFLAAAAVLAVLGYRFVLERRLRPQQIITICLAIAVCGIGWALKSDVPGHDFLKVPNVGKFLLNVALLYSWPCSAVFPWSIVIAFPTVVFVFRRLRERQELTSANAVLLGLCAWVALQICAISYSRGGSGSVLTSRYLDLVTVSVALGWIYLVREFAGRVRQGLAVAWLGIIVAGLAQQGLQHWKKGAEPNSHTRKKQEENVRAYLATGDETHLRDKPFGEIPYPDADILISRLSHDSVRAVLPASVRSTVPLAGEESPPQNIPSALQSAAAPVLLSTWQLPTEASPFTWSSLPQPASTASVLRFLVAGDLGANQKALQVVIKSAAGEAQLQPDVAPGYQWKTVNVIRPRGEWWIEVNDDDPTAWLALTAPVEVSLGSYFVGKLLKHHSFIAFTGFVFVLLGMAKPPFPKATQTSPSPAQTPSS